MCHETCVPFAACGSRLRYSTCMYSLCSQYSCQTKAPSLNASRGRRVMVGAQAVCGLQRVITPYFPSPPRHDLTLQVPTCGMGVMAYRSSKGAIVMHYLTVLTWEFQLIKNPSRNGWRLKKPPTTGQIINLNDLPHLLVALQRSSLL